VRLSDCKARHFPGLNSLREHTIDTPPKLWAHIRLHLLLVREMTNRPNPSHQRPALTPTDVQQTYALLHRLKVAGAPRPPYPSFTEGEARDELERIANLLEEEDRRRCGAQAEVTAAPPTKTPRNRANRPPRGTPAHPRRRSKAKRTS